MVVYLLTDGDGTDGNEWDVISIHSTRELAEVARAREATSCNIEEWEVDPSPCENVKGMVE